MKIRRREFRAAVRGQNSVAQAGYPSNPVAGYNPGLVIDCQPWNTAT